MLRLGGGPRPRRSWTSVPSRRILRVTPMRREPRPSNAIKRSVPEIVAIVDTTDHASGSNPYYQPAKK